MPDVETQWYALQQSISRKNNPEFASEESQTRAFVDEVVEKLYYTEVAGLFHVEFYGMTWGEAFEELSALLCKPEIAASLRSLKVGGPDEGANGTRNWDFTQIIESGVDFPHLTSFFIEQTKPEDHNHTIVGKDYDEDGMIGQLLAKMPELRVLTVPSAPNAAFFSAGTRPLYTLNVDTGYTHEDFIMNLSRSSCFPELQVLEFGDFNPGQKNKAYREKYEQYCTPYEHYKTLFTSPAFAKVHALTLKNSLLSSEQFAELHALKPNTSLYVISTTGYYIRGKQKSS